MSEPWGSILTHWHGHPDALLGLALLQGAYLLCVGPLRRRYRLADEADPRQTANFTAGILVILVALVSPIHVLSDNYLFSVHMLQHVLLTLVAPPLIILGLPEWLIRPLLRPNWSFRLARVATHPVVAFGIFNIVFSIWHVPSLYGTSVNHHSIHVAEHLMFMGSAMLMWWPIVSIMPELPRLTQPLQIGYLFALSVAQIIVFAIITFAKEPLYEFYVNAPRISTISPVLDQQIGAIAMKVASGTLFLVLMIIIFLRWFGEDEQSEQGQEVREGGYDLNGPDTLALEDR